MQAVARQTVDDTLAGGFRIGAVRGGSTFETQSLLAAFAGRRIREGRRVAGVVEAAGHKQDGICGSSALRDVSSGALFNIFQDLGRGSTACRLDGDGLAAACQAVVDAIGRGADLVVLSKFGKIEAEGGGLLDGFRAAAEAGIPCVTGVSLPLSIPFLEFAGEFSQWIEVSDSAIERWWRMQS